MNKDLTVGDPNRVLWHFCLPLFASVVFQQFYNLADSFVCGRFIGEEALASVGNSYEITLIFLAFAFGLNIGCSVIASRYFGARNYGEMKTLVSTAMITSAIVCLLLMAGGLLFGDRLLSLIHTPAELLFDSGLYLRIYVYGLPFVIFYNIATGIFSALGDSKTPFYFLAVSSLSNIAVDIFFVKTLQMGVAGVAWATFLCQGISCTLSLSLVFLRLRSMPSKEPFSFFSPRLLKQYLSIAIPSILQQSFISVGNIILQSIINGFGSGVIAGYSAGVKLNNLVITSFTTIGNGVSNYASQNIGAGKQERVHIGTKAAIRMVWIVSLFMALLYVFTPAILLRFFLKSPSEDALLTGSRFLRILSPFYFVVSAKLVMDGVLRGAGRMKEFMTGTFTDLLLRVLLAFLFSRTFLGSTGIWCAWPVGWIIATLVSAAYYRKGPWMSFSSSRTV